jgi:predicted RNA binding protein YcfA (HicA-like mRNA interferase family)
MKLPRDINASTLTKALKSLGYQVTRQTGSHIRLTTLQNGEHHITFQIIIPLKSEHYHLLYRKSQIISDIQRKK